MLIKTLVGLSLAVGVSIDTQLQDRFGLPGPGSAVHLSVQQKNAALRPLVRSATECVARTVAASPRFTPPMKGGDINELIVDSMVPCVDAMRAMMDGYDRYYGAGTGETFFSGPYLDVLPTAVHKLLDRTER
jgi:hypothetical protein